MLIASILPVLAFLAVRQLGLMSLARLGVLGVAALAAGLVVLTRPKLGVYFMLVYTYAGLSFYFPGLVPFAVMAVIATGVLLQFVGGKPVRLTDQVFLWSIALFAMIALQSMLWAHDIKSSILAFGVFIKAFLLLFLIVQVLETPEDLRSFGRVIVIGGVAAIFLGLMNLKLGLEQDMSSVGGLAMIRFSGTHADANHAAAYMISAVPVGIFFVKHGRGLIAKVVAMAAVITLVVGMFTTFSRAATISFAVVCLGVVFKEVRSRRALLVVLALLVIGILLSPKYYWIRIFEAVDVSKSLRDDWSFFLRFSALRDAWEMFLQHPLLGVGLNNFTARVSVNVFVRIVTHNMYMDVLTGLGIFGLIAYMSVLYSSLRQMVGGMRPGWDESMAWLRDFSYYLLLGLISTLVSGLFINTHFNYIVWVPIAGGLVVGNLMRAAGNRKPRLASTAD
jgi:O-antigen ligase